MNQELTSFSLFRPILIPLFCAFSSLGLGLLHHTLPLKVLPFIVATMAVVFAEVGAWLAKDYYCHRRNRSRIDIAKRTLASRIQPEQLVLKGAWGAYLSGFLFVLVLAMLEIERGWGIVLYSWIGFFAGYYEGALPLFFRQSKWGAVAGVVSSVIIPYIAMSYVFKSNVSYEVAGALVMLGVLRARASLLDIYFTS